MGFRKHERRLLLAVGLRGKPWLMPVSVMRTLSSSAADLTSEDKVYLRRQLASRLPFGYQTNLVG